MLIYAPSTPRLQLELGVLYYKIGAYDVARNYFEQALANRNVQPEVAQQIKLCLQQLSLTADPPPFSATIFSAIRWESNANICVGSPWHGLPPWLLPARSAWRVPIRSA